MLFHLNFFPLHYFRVCGYMHLFELTVLSLGHNNAPFAMIPWFGQVPLETDIASAFSFRGFACLGELQKVLWPMQIMIYPVNKFLVGLFSPIFNI